MAKSETTKQKKESACSFRSQIDYITVGLPFAAFKILFALALLRAQSGLFATSVAYALIALGVIDLTLNLLNSLSCLLLKKSITPVCFFASALALFSRKRSYDAPQHARHIDLGMALDVMLSFILVALCLALQYLKYFNSTELWTWNVAVIFNVLGAGIQRLLTSLQKEDR
ncbi:MAG TPA: hypothetical protein PLY93_06315 [Turneriella sp.]|nr:hypothetical protein [Turneriella sp.]